MIRNRYNIALTMMLSLLLFAEAAFVVAPTHAAEDQRCFPQTGQCISGRIRSYWEQNGGLPVFGYPTTPQREERIEGRTLQVQWFERNRLELHPENQPPYDVLLGRLGAEQLTQARIGVLNEEARGNCEFFAETGHNVCGAMLRAWRSYGLEFNGQSGASFDESLALFGLPVSNEIKLTLSDGRSYRVQYFERTRFELHPENAQPYDVLFGLLGNELRAGTLPQRPQSLLPAPLYFLYDNQIVRLERDGLTQTTVVDERGNGEIGGFRLSPQGNRLAYTLNRASGMALVRIDSSGASRREILTNQADIIGLRWSPDGSEVAIHIGALEVNAQGALYRVAIADGRQQVVQPDDNGAGPHVAYLPGEWSPDGSKMLLSSVVKQSEGCLPMIKDLATGSLYSTPSPGGNRPICSNAWSPDGANMYVSAVAPDGPYFVPVGLWRASMNQPISNEIVPIKSGGLFNIVTGLQPKADGSVGAFIARSEQLPQLGDRNARPYAPYTIAADGTQYRPLGSVIFDAPEIYGWSPDGSGFLLRGTFNNPSGLVKTLWVPLDGSAPWELNVAGYQMDW